MLTKVVKWIAIAALVGGGLFSSAPSSLLPMHLVVKAAAVVIVIQAAAMHRYIWMSLFLVVAALFNPIFVVLSSQYLSNLAIIFALILFFFSLELLKWKPRLSPLSPRHGGPRS